MLNVKVLTGANVEAYYAEAVVSGVEDYYLGTDAPASHSVDGPIFGCIEMSCRRPPVAGSRPTSTT